jgi:hypothetical protein
VSEMSSRGEKRERWMQLAAQVAAEQDPKKFHALVVELADVLEEREHQGISLIKSNRSDENQKVESGRRGADPGGVRNISHGAEIK